MRAHRFCGTVFLLAGLLLPWAARAGTPGFVQVNLVSDIPGLAATTDPDLVNPWGVAFSPTSPFWVADNGTGLSTLYNGKGVKQGLVVTIPSGASSAPTGAVFNASSGLFLGDRFLFATENGTIAGWQGGTVAPIRVDNSGSGSVYKGLAIDGGRIFATDFKNGRVDVFDSNYSPVSLPGGFTDPTLPAGYAPFGIRELSGDIFVTYAKVKFGTSDDEAGPGFGFVDKFDTNGNLLTRLVTDGALNSPWGMALAPAGFGSFGGDLLVGNFGDGRINAYDPVTGAFIDTLLDKNGSPLVIDGLWSLDFGNGSQFFDPKKLYFTAGINGEGNGLFGNLQAVPEPASLILAGAGAMAVAFMRRRPGRQDSSRTG
ncbi:TIGR03118 family protein [Fundidesulfovibrio terrae]|uniref:TIGR03118 family protein n=1 Tax=Fundidesulfovibrio terrae TaxID=2922866 RepID=UPI001FAF2D4B|nr:TIGR03118 family protein [Fundidesulfovibrio terrae]